ncbi:hypothetical protein [Ulvibacterium sp.]|uniref:hypothetical protein n=1 Tax=Ulvibacterium sp. TaxID=2665914 RepID=UPI002603B4D5|nr:hypothetical protein [Ulvibacterium sp.]
MKKTFLFLLALSIFLGAKAQEKIEGPSFKIESKIMMYTYQWSDQSGFMDDVNSKLLEESAMGWYAVHFETGNYSYRSVLGQEKEGQNIIILFNRKVRVTRENE